MVDQLLADKASKVRVDVEGRLIILAYQDADGRVIEIGMPIGMAGALIADLQLMITSLAQQAATQSANPRIPGLRKALEVNEIAVVPGATPDALGVFLEPRQSYSLLWSLKTENVDQLVKMLLDAKAKATSKPPN